MCEKEINMVSHAYKMERERKREKREGGKEKKRHTLLVIREMRITSSLSDILLAAPSGSFGNCGGTSEGVSGGVKGKVGCVATKWFRKGSEVRAPFPFVCRIGTTI